MWSSNVDPPNFKRKDQPDPDWECICGTMNKGNVKYKRANRVCCMMCGIEKELAMLAKEDDPSRRGA